MVGGAGYIGSQMGKLLLEKGYDLITLDNLSTGFRELVLGGEFIQGDLGDETLLDTLFQKYPIDAVMHFAAFIQVGESVEDPAKYYVNNVAKTLSLLNSMVRHGVSRFIFSSTAAVYGEPDYVPIDEKHPLHPINPYGCTKWMVEQILSDYDRAYGLKSIALRYFNAAGADPDAKTGCMNDTVTNLIPVVMQTVVGKRPQITVFGRDYPTVDGTGVRDYIHVYDLSTAHLAALKWLLDGGPSEIFNLGNGAGYSVQQVLDASQKVCGLPFKVVEGARRAGDPAELIADSSKATRSLGWKPRYPDLETIVQHAWNWERGRRA